MIELMVPEKVVRIRETRKWSTEYIREMCIDNDWYTRGNTREYSEMLDLVDREPPTTENIYRVAKDIYEHSEHSDGLEITSVMFEIANHCVFRFFEIL